MIQNELNHNVREGFQRKKYHLRWRQHCSIRNILEYIGVSRNIQEHLGTSRNIWEHLGTSRNIQEHLGTSGNIQEHLETILYHLGPFEFHIERLRTLKPICRILYLSIIYTSQNTRPPRSLLPQHLQKSANNMNKHHLC